jgi:hypothetical protein
MASADDEFVLVFEAPSMPLAEVATTKLESEGIQVLVKGGTAAYAYPTGATQLWVRRDQFDRAKRILDEADEGKLQAEGLGGSE